ANSATVSAIRSDPTSITLTASDSDLGSGESLEFIILTSPFGGSLDYTGIVPNELRRFVFGGMRRMSKKQ
ncbi:MAG: hypothetical protein JKX95_09305, partial [Bacteroidia bacterium]|nr:hypothetical protein [Bacteroidia bacterium]